VSAEFNQQVQQHSGIQAAGEADVPDGRSAPVRQCLEQSGRKIMTDGLGCGHSYLSIAAFQQELPHAAIACGAIPPSHAYKTSISLYELTSSAKQRLRFTRPTTPHRAFRLMRNYRISTSPVGAHEQREAAIAVSLELSNSRPWAAPAGLKAMIRDRNSSGARNGGSATRRHRTSSTSPAGCSALRESSARQRQDHDGRLRVAR
jgi:hypothetical protein